ncbi:Calcium-transporting ATPase 1 [Caulifigura coniformis]|uniref:Calcium-transporting ATPase 1 n=1 Tax=Caulifigura coniformis TaxID=2527983 RepID=A0A517S9G0_9PLAN|nr:cation-translocating P-type ATPase [Caulifigura coniformis]QDT52761.1 Calcium-transporting ATPase 1 [Caulifigura coniformis]
MPGHTLFSLSTEQAVLQLRANAEQGLSTVEAVERQKQSGFNQLTEAAPEPAWKRLFRQFQDLVIWILIAAAVISGLLGEWVDTLAILAIVVLNGVIGFLQEQHAELAMSALKKLSAPTAKALRDGVLQSLPARELVPGDIIEIEAGDNVPADVRLLKAFSVSVQEATLTGESTSVEKEADVVLPAETQLGDRRNMVHMGTILTTGKASGMVAAIGMETELGQIAGMLARHELELTPLQKRLAKLGQVLIGVCLAIVALIFALQVMRGGSLLEALLVSVSLAVAAVPEGLPAVVTITLALGLQRMVKRKALVRKLPSVETLGSVSVICSDKTGTLTRNEMTVKAIVTSSKSYQVTGGGYAPRGDFYQTSDSTLVDDEALPKVARTVNPETDLDLRLALKIGAWCNGAQVAPQSDGDGVWQVIGDPTEGALVVAAMKGGLSPSARSGEITYELPFDSNRKIMSVVVREPGGTSLYTKGAPESVLARCDRIHRWGVAEPLSEDDRRRVLASSISLSSQALRVLGVAYGPDPREPGSTDLERELVFCGLVGMIDPPREEVKTAIATCRSAGIRPVMITGDHPATALAIAKQLGLTTGPEHLLAGQELAQMTDADLAGVIHDISVYARTTAEHKLRIVRAWKSRGDVVAMTGDGVNDAPAVRAADIGIAMGITGTDVTKEASDMVLLDDNFASIVSAVEEGRGIYDNIQKALVFLLSCNCGEILLMLGASLLGWPAPLLPIQLLWINLVTDGLPALALSFEPPEPGVMNHPPRQANESILSRKLGIAILFQGLLVGLVGLLAFGLSLRHRPDDVDRARAMAFCVLVYAELFRALGARSQTLTLRQLGFWKNPHLLLAILVSGLLQVSVAIVPFTGRVFDVPPHTWSEWGTIILLALTPLIVVELVKELRQVIHVDHVITPDGVTS